MPDASAQQETRATPRVCGLALCIDGDSHCLPDWQVSRQEEEMSLGAVRNLLLDAGRRPEAVFAVGAALSAA
jgi:hypothetical protein